jgi:hypothetical protein
MPVGPGQAALIVHFCGRPARFSPTPHVPEHIAKMDPQTRLDRILTEGLLRGFPPFGAEADQPMVCFSASPADHLEHLLRRGWHPWGLVVRRQWVYDRGGAPVRHLRPDDFARQAHHDKPWSVRLDSSLEMFSDWTDELEWRVPLPPGRPSLPLTPNDVVALLVGEPDWQVSDTAWLYWDNEIRDPNHPDVYTDPSLQPVRPVGPWANLPRWRWDPITETLLQPQLAGAG